MSQWWNRLHTRRRWFFPLGLAVMTAAAGICHAQQDRIIHLVVQTDPNLNAFEVENKFKTARDSTNGFSFKDIKVHPVDPESYVMLSSIMRNGQLEDRRDEKQRSGVLVEPVKSQQGAWWIDLQDPARFLERADVTLVDASSQQEKTVTLDVKPRLAEDAQLRFHSPGGYIFKPEKGKLPLAATLHVTTEADDGSVSGPEQIRVGWPDVGRCYLVTLMGVTGDENKLFDSLKDKRKVGNPIRELYPSTTTLIVGTFREKGIWDEPGHVALRYLPPANAAPSRLWIRFPLTESEEAATLAELDKQLAPDDGFKKVPAWVEANKLKPGSRLSPGQTAWVEVPWNADEQRFDYLVPLATEAWQQALSAAPDKVGDRAVLVWEFQSPANPRDREAIRVGGANGKRYQVERLPWWLPGLVGAPVK